MDEHEQSERFLFDLDPPEGRRQRVIGALLWLAVALLLAIPLRLLLTDDGASTQVASGLAEMCSRFALPALLREFAGIAYPIWNNVCDVVGR